jgi:NADH:ubiquinone oxidoreductase subunit B-like Fe-S oxidoreductase
MKLETRLENSDSFITRLIKRIDTWASSDYFVPCVVSASAGSGEMITHLSRESSTKDVFLADQESTSLRPDLLIINGIINYRNLESVIESYKNLSGNKYVMVIGKDVAKAYQLADYNIVNDISKYVPVDLYVPGLPPSRRDILNALNALKEMR